jgi:uncharacterized FAD-dependent dehydrogenase
MLEVSGIRIQLDELDGSKQAEEKSCRMALLHRLHLAPEELISIEPRHRSIDARKRGDIHLTFTLRISLRGGIEAEHKLLKDLSRHHADREIRIVEEHPYSWPGRLSVDITNQKVRPVVVGAGCAGLFCALTLAEAGLCPLLIERGDDATRRSAAVAAFDAGGPLDLESNIQFGLGGAGTFSDGKLNTGTKSPAHRLILSTFVKAGAPAEILWDAKPHVGSDILPNVVTHIVDRIKELGGEIRFRCRMIALGISGPEDQRHIRSVRLESTKSDGQLLREDIPACDVVVACGHSARDVFSLLNDEGIFLERKTFAMGVRIEHLQSDIDRTLYGSAAGHPALGAAPYKLVAHLPKEIPHIGGRSAFSFCMCPGGYVVAATSEAGGVVTNGMSLAARDGINANSGLLANVFPTDLPGKDSLAGITLQRQCEQAAFIAGGSTYAAPAQLVGDFLANVASTGPGRVIPTYPRGVRWGKIDECLPNYITATLRAAIPLMDRRLHGFASSDAVLTGVETRSSSPVRIVRDHSLQSISCRGLWPTGEGAGYAGGIMSAAADGIRIAEALIDTRKD